MMNRTPTKIVGRKKMDGRREIGADKIEEKSDEVRARFATPGKHVIYDKKLQEAQRYIEAINSNKPPADLKKFPYLRKEVGLTAPTPLELANLWITMNESWDEISPLIGEISLRGKYAVKSAKSQDEIDEILLNTLDQLDSIGEPKPSMIGKTR
jgi:hypothetical protein